MRTPARRLQVWRLLTGTGGAATAGFGLLVLACVFLAVAAPREGLALRTRALQHALTMASPLARSVVGTADYTDISAGLNGPADAHALAVARAGLAANLSREGLPLAPPAADWSGLSSGFFPVTGGPPALSSGGLPPQMEVLYREDLSRYVTVAAGRLPSGAQATSNGGIFQIAVTSATAARFGLRPGSRIGTRTGTGITLVVTGVVRPVAAGAASQAAGTPQAAATSQAAGTFWAADPVAATPAFIQHSSNFSYWTGAGFVGPAALPLLERRLDPAFMSVSWDFPLALGSLTPDGAQALQGGLTRAASQGGLLGSGAGFARGLPEPVTLTSGVASTLASFAQQDAAAGPVLSLLSVSLTVIAAVVILLGARLVAERRQGEFALRRARGAARWQVALLTLEAAAAVTLPAAAVGGAIAVALTPGYAGPPVGWLAVLIVVIALAAPPVIAFRLHRVAGLPGAPQSGRPVSRRAAGRRLAAEAALLVAAVGGLVVLRQQGLPAAGGGSLYPSLAPMLVAIPAAILVMRCYPAMVRALLRLARLRPGASAFVGFARAAQAPLNAGVSAFALVLALTVVAFGAMVHSAVIRAEMAASWQLTGADAVIDASPSSQPLTPAVQREISAVPGVQRTAALLVTSGSAHGTALTVVAVRPAQYQALIADTPGGAFPASKLAGAYGKRGRGPALASLAAGIGRGPSTLNLEGRDITIEAVGTASPVPGVPDSAFVVVPWQALGASPPPPSLMLAVGPRLDERQLRAVVHRDLPGAVVTLRATVLASLTAAPLPGSAYLAITAGSVVAAVLTVLILLIALMLGTHSRDLTLARLRVMGLAARQARWLVAAEVLPQVVAAAVGGVVCALALAPLVGPSINLSAFTGNGASVPIHPESVPLAGALAGLVVLALLTLAAQTAIASRRGADRALWARE